MAGRAAPHGGAADASAGTPPNSPDRAARAAADSHTPLAAGALPARGLSDPAEPARARANTGRKSKRPRREDPVGSDDEAGEDEPATSRGRCRAAATPHRADPAAEVRRALAAAVRDVALGERREARERLRRDARRLGRFRRGLLGGAADGDAAVQWEGGEDDARIEALRERISEQRKFVEASRKSVNGKRPLHQSHDELEDDIWEQRELCSSKLAAINRDEAELKDREQRLRAERDEHFRQARAIEVEDHIGFGDLAPLGSPRRYQLLRLASKGAHITVYRAYDLNLMRMVTLRVHTLDPKVQDKPGRLQEATQECERIRQLKHVGLVPMLDHFLHEANSFVTVWELVDGDTVDSYLRRNGPLPEKEARGIAMQLLATLRFLEAKGRQLAAHDVRPARLALRAGEVKISGAPLLGHLCRGAAPAADRRALVRHSSALTEVQPEPCGAGGPHDGGDGWLGGPAAPAVWSVGATLHELLFSRPPEAAPEPGAAVQLPDAPRISAECRDFLCRLLNREGPPSLHDLSSDVFVSQRRR